MTFSFAQLGPLLQGSQGNIGGGGGESTTYQDPQTQSVSDFFGGVGGLNPAKMLSGAASFYASSLSKRKAKEYRRRARKYGVSILNDLKRSNAAFGALSEEQLQSALDTIRKGYGAARSEVEGIGQGAKQRAYDRETQAGGAAQQALVDRGLSSTTRRTSVSRGIRSDTERALLDIDDSIAQIQSGITAAGTQAEAQGIGNIAQLFQNLSAQEAARLQSLFRLFSGQTGIHPTFDTKFDFGGLASAFSGKKGGQ